MTSAANETREKGPLPGDLTPDEAVSRMLRVDHAGEHGAVRIYAGQLAVLGDRHPMAPAIRAMAEQERTHLETFDRLIVERRVRPTALSPLWHIAGYALGAATALLGPKAAMACTVAVEEEIDRHYARQVEALATMPNEAPLRDTVEAFRADELEHERIGRENGAEDAPGFPVLRAVIGAGSRLAIWLSQRV